MVKRLWWQGSWGQHGTQLGPTGPMWAPCWPHEICYLEYVADMLICANTARNMTNRFSASAFPNAIRMPWDLTRKTQRTRDAIMTSLLRQNDVITSFWRNGVVIFASCVRWEAAFRYGLYSNINNTAIDKYNINYTGYHRQEFNPYILNWISNYILISYIFQRVKIFHFDAHVL